MSGSESSDILMFFMVGNTPLTGECTTELTVGGKTPNELLKDFGPRRMFEIASFGFGVGDGSQAKKDDKDGKTAKTPPPKAKTEGGSLNKVTVQPVTFTRMMDVASTALLSHFIARTKFTRAALVKRKAAGSLAAGEPYLRFDFKKVLISEAKWTNDDPVKESYTFYARAITMRYRPQLPDGTLGIVRQGFWSMAPDQTADYF